MGHSILKFKVKNKKQPTGTQCGDGVQMAVRPGINQQDTSRLHSGVTGSLRCFLCPSPQTVGLGQDIMLLTGSLREYPQEFIFTRFSVHGRKEDFLLSGDSDPEKIGPKLLIPELLTKAKSTSLDPRQCCKSIFYVCLKCKQLR